MDYADKFDDQISGLTQPKPEIDKSPAKVTPQVANQLVPMQGFDVGKTAAGSVSTSPLANTPGLLKPMQDFAKLDPRAPQMPIAAPTQPAAPAMTPEEHAKKQAEYDAFAAAKTKNPEWYVGDTYVGTDKAAKDAAMQQAAAGQVQRKQLIAGVNENQYGSTDFRRDSGQKEFESKFGYTGELEKPLSYNEFVTKTKELKTHAMREMVAKYGETSAAKAEKLIDQAIADKQGAYADKVDMQARSQLYNALGDTTTTQGMQRALFAAVEYNKTAKRLGKDGIDTAMLGKILENGDTQIVSKNLGDRDIMFAVNRNGKAFGYDRSGNPVYYRPVAELPYGISPDTKANIISKERTNAENNRVKLQTTQMQNNNRLQVANINAAAKSRGGKGPSHAERKWADTLSSMYEAAVAAKSSGATESDPDDHSVEDYRAKAMEALRSGDLDDDDKAAVIEQLKGLGVW